MKNEHRLGWAVWKVTASKLNVHIDEWFTPVCFSTDESDSFRLAEVTKEFYVFKLWTSRRRVRHPWTENRSRKPLLLSETSLSNPSDLFGLKTLADLTKKSQGNIYSCKAIKIQPAFLFFFHIFRGQGVLFDEKTVVVFQWEPMRGPMWSAERECVWLLCVCIIFLVCYFRSRVIWGCRAVVVFQSSNKNELLQTFVLSLL